MRNGPEWALLQEEKNEKKRSALVIFLVLAIVVVVAQLNVGIFEFAQANLMDRDDLYEFVQQEIIDIPREVFDTWEVFYLDVTSDGVDEAVLVSPYGQHWHPLMEIIRLDGRKLQRIVLMNINPKSLALLLMEKCFHYQNSYTPLFIPIMS